MDVTPETCHLYIVRESTGSVIRRSIDFWDAQDEAEQVDVLMDRLGPDWQIGAISY